MKPLDLTINVNSRTYTQIKRDTYKAMYLSNDGYYEIFRIYVAPKSEIFGTMYPERETYPGTEEFGVRAWCTNDKDRAEMLYDEIKPKEELNECI